MMQLTTPYCRSRRAHRGFVLIAAISVLVILTLLVFGLAASRDVAQGRAALDSARRVAGELVHTALDTVDAAPVPAADGDRPTTATASVAAARGVVVLPEGKFLVVARPVQDGESCYAPPLLVHREGDRLAIVCVEVPLGPKALRLTETYLINTTGDKARRVLLRGAVTTEESGGLRADDRETLLKQL